MRMWMVNPSLMCDKHLRAEHCEIHTFVGAINLGKNVNGFIRNNELEIKSLRTRHDELVSEMLGRGWKHNSPLAELNSHVLEALIPSDINKEASLKLLKERCEKCRAKIEREIHGELEFES